MNATRIFKYAALACACLASTPSSPRAAEPEETYRRFWGQIWGIYNPNEMLAHAREMGYKYVMAREYIGDAEDSLKQGLRFVFDHPDRDIARVRPTVNLEISESELPALKEKYGKIFEFFPHVPRWVENSDFNKLKTDHPDYWEEYKRVFLEFYGVEDTTKEFPENLNRAWGTSATPDFQQQKVIDLWVENTVTVAKEMERPEIGWHFGGIGYDRPELWKEAGLENRSLIKLEGITYDYDSYYEASMQYFAQLLEALNAADFAVQPIMYTEQGVGHAKAAKNSQTLTPEQKELVAGHMIYDEGGDDIVLNNEARFYGFTNSELGIAGHGSHAHWDSYWCKVLGFTATQGSWYTVWGRYGGSGRHHRFTHMVVNSHLLIFAISLWDNVRNIPLTSREAGTYDNGSYYYKSPYSHVDSTIIYSRHAENDNIYARWLEKDAVITLREGESLGNVWCANGLWQKCFPCNAAVEQVDNTIVLKADHNHENGYIIEIDGTSADPDGYRIEVEEIVAPGRQEQYGWEYEWSTTSAGPNWGYVIADSTEATIPFRASLSENGIDLSIRYRFERSNDSCTFTVVADGNEVLSWTERDVTNWTTIEKAGLAIDRDADIEIKLKKGNHKVQVDWIQLNEAPSVATTPHGKPDREAGLLRLSFKTGTISLARSSIDPRNAFTLSINDLRGRNIQRHRFQNTDALQAMSFPKLTPGLYTATVLQGETANTTRFLIR